MQKNCKWIVPTWPISTRVRALTTLREGGYSVTPYEGCNFAQHVDDSEQAVLANRQLLFERAQLPAAPFWLTQVHGTRVVEVSDGLVEADASVAFQAGQVCAVLTADCLPLLLCNEKGTCVGAVHAGWRGLSAGIIEATVETLNCDPKTLLAWMGPAIGPTAFEVGEEVIDAFQECRSAFQPKDNGKWLANIYALATQRLHQLGIFRIFGGDYCTYCEPDKFYSFRRSKITGRMATLIWIPET